MSARWSVVVCLCIGCSAEMGAPPSIDPGGSAADLHAPAVGVSSLSDGIAAPDAIALDNGVTSLALVRDGTGYAIDAVTADDGFGFALVHGKALSQITVGFRDETTRELVRYPGTVLSGGVARIERPSESELIQRWSGLESTDGAVAGLDLEMRIVLPPGEPFGEVTLAAEADVAPGAVETLRLDLRVADADPGGDRDRLVINGRGSLEVPDPTKALSGVFRIRRPNAGLTLEMWPYTVYGDADEGDHVMYLAVHDPDGYNRNLRIGAEAPADSFELSVEHVGVEGDPRVAFPYPVAIGALRGGWFEAAQVYRRFILERTTWLDRGTLAQRASDPGDHGGVATGLELIQSTIPIAPPGSTPDHDPVDVEAELGRRIAMRDYYDVADHALVMDWGWSRGSIWELTRGAGVYPPREGYVELVQRSREEGLRTGGYTIMLSFDRRLPQMEEWGVAEALCRDETGKPRGGRWYDIDPATARASEIFDRIIPHLHDDVGLASIHNDNFGMDFCYPESGEHPAPGGFRWTEAARALLRSEEAAGMWNDVETGTLELGPTFLSLQGLISNDGITVDHSAIAIPLAPAVAHEYQLFTGLGWDAPFDALAWVFSVTSDPGARSLALLTYRAAHAAEVAWGLLPVVLDPRATAQSPWESPMAPVTEMVRDAVRARRRAHRWLVLGRMLEPPRTDIPVVTRPVSPAPGVVSTRRMPEVFLNGFASPGGEVLVVAASPGLSGAVHRVTMTVPASWPLPAGADLTVHRLGSDAVLATVKLGGRLAFDVADGEVALLRIEGPPTH